MQKPKTRYKNNRIFRVVSSVDFISDRALDIILAAVLAITLLCILVSTLGIINKHNSIINQSELVQSAKSLFYHDLGYEEGIKALQEQNSEIKAWMLIENTVFDTPVCQAEDDNFYLNHDYLGQENAFGTPFFMSEDLISRNRPDQNLIIYGKNEGDRTAFGSLDNFFDLNFYNQHHIIRLYTKYGSTPYVVFAVMILPDVNSGDKEFLDVTRSSFGSDRQFNEWLKMIEKNNFLSTEIKVGPHNNLLTLVTNRQSNENERLVVMARELELFEGSNMDIGTVTIKKGAKPLKNSKAKK